MNTTTNIWGTKRNANLETAITEQLVIESALADLAASRANKFNGAAVVAVSGVAVVEYEEKQFSGPSMSDDEWSSL